MRVRACCSAFDFGVIVRISTLFHFGVKVADAKWERPRRVGPAIGDSGAHCRSPLDFIPINQHPKYHPSAHHYHCQLPLNSVCGVSRRPAANQRNEVCHSASKIHFHAHLHFHSPFNSLLTTRRDRQFTTPSQHVCRKSRHRPRK